MPSKANLLSRVWALIRVTRGINLLMLVFTQYMVRYFLASRQSYSVRDLIFDWRLLLLSLATACIAAAGYIINDYYDLKIDAVNKPEKVVIDRQLTRKEALLSHLFLQVMGLVIAAIFSIKVFIVFLAAAFMLWFYSNYLKRTPMVGNILVAMLTGMAVLLPGLVFKERVHLAGIFAVYAFWISLIREIIKDMEDIRGDMKFGAKTLPVVWGYRKTKWVIYAITAMFVANLFWLSGKLGIWLTGAYLVLLVPLAYLIFALSQADTKKEFGRLSTWCKWLMFAGVLSMVFV